MGENATKFNQDKILKVSPSLILSTLCYLLISGCASVPQSYTDGSLQYRSGNYAAAASSFEAAAKQAPSNEAILLPLAEAHFKLAELASSDGDNVNPLDLRLIIAHYTKSQGHAEKSLTALRTPLAKPDEGPGFVDRMKKMTDSKYLTLRERQTIQNKDSLKLKSSIDEKQLTTQTTLDKVLEETARLLTANRQNPDSAYDEYVAYFPYAPYLPEVRDAKLEFEQLSIKQLELNGHAQIEALNYAAAEQTFKRQGTILGGTEQSDAGIHAITGHQNFNKQDYEGTFATLLSIRSIHPDSVFLKNYFEKTQALLITTKLAEVDTLIAKRKLAGFITGFEILEKIATAAEGNPALVPLIEQRRKSLRTLAAGAYIQQAKELKALDEMLYSSLILRNLKLARQFDPEQTAILEPDAAKALGISNRKSEMKVLVAYEGNSNNSTEWAKRLESDLFSALEKSDISGLTVLDKTSLKGASENDLSNVDVAINGSMEHVEFIERGRDSPRRRSSKYISGTRQVNNPRYHEAEESYRSAEATYRSSYQLQEQVKRKCRELDNVFAKIACEATVSYVSSSSRDNAYAKWQSTPQYVDQNIISSYQYDHYTVSVNGQVRGNCTISDNLNRSQTKCTAINEKIKREGTIIANAQTTDTEGIKNAEENVPDLNNEQEEAYKQISASIAAELLQNLSALRAERYCKLADNLGKQNVMLKAMEAYSMCSLVIGNTRHERSTELDEKLNSYFILSPASAQRFGAEGNNPDEAWPVAAEIDDSALKIVMTKFNGS